ncbi:hypothetical protein DRN58_08695, partial [Thermococci archaeon]
NQNTKTMAEIYGITRRRVQQLVKEYRKTGEVPKLKKNRRPRTYHTKKEKKITLLYIFQLLLYLLL